MAYTLWGGGVWEGVSTLRCFALPTSHATHVYTNTDILVDLSKTCTLYVCAKQKYKRNIRELHCMASVKMFVFTRSY